MRADQDAMLFVRAELCRRLDSLQHMSARRPASEVAHSVATIRQVAAAYGLTPVVRLAEAMERSLASTEGSHRCPTALYLDRLRDAIGCARIDEAASEAMIASVSVRLSA